MGVKINFDSSKLADKIRREAINKIKVGMFDTTCPKCSSRISVKVGKNHCSNCNSEIDYKLNRNI